MRTLELSKALKPLAEYATEVEAGPVLVTRRGKPLAAVVSMHGIDRESLALSTNSRFLEIIEEARASRSQGTISDQEMRQRLGVGAPKPQRRKHRRAK